MVLGIIVVDPGLESVDAFVSQGSIEVHGVERPRRRGRPFETALPGDALTGPQEL
jgi:hypothetical protein